MAQTPVIGEFLGGLTYKKRPVGQAGSTVAMRAAAKSYVKTYAAKPTATTRLLANVTVAKARLTSRQSVVKRIRAGGCHNVTQLTRQIDYITRDDTVETWSFDGGELENVSPSVLAENIAGWEDNWYGNPRYGHTDHFIISFPKDVDPEVGAAISRQWACEVFGGGLSDRWSFVTTFHTDSASEHPHAHIVVNKRGMDEGEFLSISDKERSHTSYDEMRDLHVTIAAEHGVELFNTPRLSRGIIEKAPRQSEVRAALSEDREVVIEDLSETDKVYRTAAVEAFADHYAKLSTMFEMVPQTTAAPSLAALCRQYVKALETGEMTIDDQTTYSPDVARRAFETIDSSLALFKTMREETKEADDPSYKTQMELSIERNLGSIYHHLSGNPTYDELYVPAQTESPYAIPAVRLLADANYYASKGEMDDLTAEKVQDLFERSQDVIYSHFLNNQNMLALEDDVQELHETRFAFGGPQSEQLAQSWTQSETDNTLRDLREAKSEIEAAITVSGLDEVPISVYDELIRLNALPQTKEVTEQFVKDVENAFTADQLHSMGQGQIARLDLPRDLGPSGGYNIAAALIERSPETVGLSGDQNVRHLVNALRSVGLNVAKGSSLGRDDDNCFSI